MAQIAVFGGSFNPPTGAHEAIVSACLDVKHIDEVWVMPSGDRLDKQFTTTDSDRVSMLEHMRKEVFSDDRRLHISRFELDLPRPSQTWRTYKELTKHFPEHTFHFVFGTDSYASMPGWKEGDCLRREMPMLIIERPGTPYVPAPNVRRLDVVNAPVISSTMIREAVAAGLPWRHQVSAGVARYILENSLYRRA